MGLLGLVLGKGQWDDERLRGAGMTGAEKYGSDTVVRESYRRF